MGSSSPNRDENKNLCVATTQISIDVRCDLSNLNLRIFFPSFTSKGGLDSWVFLSFVLLLSPKAPSHEFHGCRFSCLHMNTSPRMADPMFLEKAPKTPSWGRELIWPDIMGWSSKDILTMQTKLMGSHYLHQDRNVSYNKGEFIRLIEESQRGNSARKGWNTNVTNPRDSANMSKCSIHHPIRSFALTLSYRKWSSQTIYTPWN